MRGLVEGADGLRRERFVGWLALLAALERLVNDVPAPRPLRARATSRRRK